MKVVFNFGGFYESFYSEEIDSTLEDENQDLVDAIDFKKLHIEVAKAITIKFNEFLSNEYDLDLNLKFKSLDSPKYYNYSTDTILLKLSKKDRVKLDLLVVNDSNVKSVLEGIVDDATTSKSGYIPFYDYDKVMAKIDAENSQVYYQSLFDALIDMNKDEYNNVTLDRLSETIYQNI